MSLLQKLLKKTGLNELASIFKAPVDDEEIRQRTLDWINHYIGRILDRIDEDIQTEKLGFHPHPENRQALNERADSLGYLQYIIEDKAGKRLELSQLNLVSCNSIKMTDNYIRLKQKLNDAGYIIELKEIDIDGDGVETYNEIDEYLDEFYRYFVITISGWSDEVAGSEQVTLT